MICSELQFVNNDDINSQPLFVGCSDDINSRVERNVNGKAQRQRAGAERARGVARQSEEWSVAAERRVEPS